MYVVSYVQLDLSNVCVHFTHKNGERAPLWSAPCWLLVPATAYNVQTGHCVLMSAARAASAGALLNTSSEVYIGNTRHKCFLYLYLMFCIKYMYVCLLTHWLLQLFHCFCYHTPFICCSPCLNLHDFVIICIAVRYVDSEVRTHDTADRCLKDTPVLYGR